jgi:peptidoglycan/xylan/chitin deacetylase (PgdA/CDA1 family)
MVALYLFSCKYTALPMNRAVLPAAAHRSDTLQRTQPRVYTVYLTIDDGPSVASGAIDMLSRFESARINVFLIGARLGKYPAVLPAYRQNEYIEISNHSYSHAWQHFRQYYTNPDSVVYDIERNMDTLGITNRIIRLPGRNAWRIQERRYTDLKDAVIPADLLAAKGYRIFGWDLEWQAPADSAAMLPADTLIARIGRMTTAERTFTPGHLVILCHDYLFETPDNLFQLQRLIQFLAHHPLYRLEWLSNYPLRNEAVVH